MSDNDKFKDKWLVIWRAAKLFFVSTLLVLALIPVSSAESIPIQCRSGLGFRGVFWES